MTPRSGRLFLFLLAMPVLLAGCVGACSQKPEEGDDDDDDFVVGECDAGDAAFARNATLGVLGRRTLGQWEASEILAVASNAGASQSARRGAILDELFANQQQYVDRWAEAIMDHLRVARLDDQAMFGCYDAPMRGPDAGELARHVRDNPASDTGDGNGAFNMRDLLESAIVADDLSPVYRAHLFAMLSRPIPAANVPPLEAELARRQDFGFVFDAAYLNRDLVCLGCHNAEYSVTDGDGDEDRHWPVPGLLEKALYGASTGTNPDNAHAMFRCQDFVADPFGLCGASGPAQSPWGWTDACGEFSPDPPPDPAGISVTFATLSGDATTVYDLEAALQRGVDVLAEDGLVLGGDGTPADPEAAFAYLLGMSIAEMAWEEIVGSPLTIANYYPRNEAARDELKRITDAFVASHFSLETLITAILASPYVNQHAPDAGCGEPYAMPAIYDPWVLGESTEELRHNSPADGVAALPAVVATRAAHSALGWPLPPDRTFPQTTDQLVFLRGVGAFLKNGEPGFRALDFQARLVWEDAYAPCVGYTAGGAPVTDWVDTLVTSAVDQDATVRDVVVALKDRLVNETSIDETAGGSGEGAALEALFGAPLDSPASSVPSLEAATRRYCGVLLSTPQFLLSGLAEPAMGPTPALNPGP